MRILAIESSGLVASCAILEDDVLLGEYTTDFKKTHSETLLPMIDSLCRLISLDKSTIDFVAVSSGPGSFTGLRIGGTTAKGIAMALNIPIVSVPTLMGLSFNLWGAKDNIVPLMDARRGEAYTGIFEFCDSEDIDSPAGHLEDAKGLAVNVSGHLEDAKGFATEATKYLALHKKKNIRTILTQCAVPISYIIDRVNENKRPVIFLGDGVPVFSEYIEKNCAVDFSFAPGSLNRQRASSVASLAMEYLRVNGITQRLSDEELTKLRLPDIDDVALFAADDFRPQYLRLSQAERERLEKMKA